MRLVTLFAGGPIPMPPRPDSVIVPVLYVMPGLLVKPGWHLAEH